MLVTMSDKKLSRINVIQSVVEKRMRRRDAAHQLALTERQTQRLMNRFRESGAAGLANLRRGRPGNHRLPKSLKLRVLSLLHDHYSDFGPTLAAEKLRERHNIRVFLETLRKWMTADGLWVPYSRRRPRVHVRLLYVDIAQQQPLQPVQPVAIAVVIAAAATVMIVIRPTPCQAALAEVVEAVAVDPAAVQSPAGQNRVLPFPTQPPRYNLSHRFAKR